MNLSVLRYPDPLLRVVAKPADLPLDGNAMALVDGMIETMRVHRAIGLGATQVGSDLRIFVLDQKYVNDQKGADKESLPALIFVNPMILKASDETDMKIEACLSLPGATAQIRRPSTVLVQAFTPNGESFEVDARDLYARAIQHELDHLDGVLLIDRVGTTQKGMIRKRMARMKKAHDLLVKEGVKFR